MLAQLYNSAELLSRNLFVKSHYTHTHTHTHTHTRANTIYMGVFVCVGRENVVSLATRYRLDGQDVECRWGQDFLYPPGRPWNTPSVPYNGNPDILGSKAAEAWR